MRADFGKGGEQVCRSRKAGVGNQTPESISGPGRCFRADGQEAHACPTQCTVPGPAELRSAVGGPPCPHKTGEKSTN